MLIHTEKKSIDLIFVFGYFFTTSELWIEIELGQGPFGLLIVPINFPLLTLDRIYYLPEPSSLSVVGKEISFRPLSENRNKKFKKFVIKIQK